MTGPAGKEMVGPPEEGVLFVKKRRHAEKTGG